MRDGSRPSSAHRSSATVVSSVAMTAAILVAALVLASTAHAANRAFKQHPTIVSITFDDGFSSQMLAAQILQQYGFHATFYVNSELLNGDGRLSFAQLRLLESSGHEIGGHTGDHMDLVTVDVPERQRQVCADRIALSRVLGHPLRSFAYPYGASDAATERVVQECGYSSARTVGGLTSPPDCRKCTPIQAAPPRDRFRVRTSYSFVSTTPIGNAEEAITRTMQHGGGWIPLVFHQVCDNCSRLSIRPARFQSLLGWISRHRADGVEVRTVGTVVGGKAHPLVPGPRQGGSYGRLVNASLSQPGVVASIGSDVAGDGADTREATRCWRRAGYGVHVATWTRGPIGLHASIAESLRVSGYVSGDAKLMVRRDGGSCSPRVKAGSSYEISVWYRSTLPLTLVAYARTSAGHWRYWTKSPPARPSSSWTRSSFVLPAVAAGMTNVSFGAAVAGNGVATVDDFGMRSLSAPNGLERMHASARATGSRAFVGALLLIIVVLPVLGAVVFDRVRKARSARRV